MSSTVMSVGTVVPAEILAAGQPAVREYLDAFAAHMEAEGGELRIYGYEPGDYVVVATSPGSGVIPVAGLEEILRP